MCEKAYGYNNDVNQVSLYINWSFKIQRVNPQCHVLTVTLISLNIVTPAGSTKGVLLHVPDVCHVFCVSFISPCIHNYILEIGNYHDDG